MGEEEEENEQQQQQQQQQQPLQVDTQQEEDEMSKDVSTKSVSVRSESAPSQNVDTGNAQGGGMRKTPTSNSWAKLMGRNQVSTISPKRRALPVVDYVSSAFDVKAKGGKGFQSKSPKQIAAIISQAIQAKSIVWISYNGHQKPFIPRAVKA